MDIITYALLKKKITSALTGVKDIKLDPEHTQTIIFTTNDGTEFSIKIPTPDVVWVGEEAPPADSDYELWVDTSDSGVESLHKTLLEEEIVATTVIGSVTKGKVYPIGTSLETIIREILTSHSRPTVVLTPDPNKELYDKVNDTIESIITKATITKGTDDIQSITFYVDGVEDLKIVQDKDHNIKDGGKFQSEHTFDPATNENFILKVTVNDGKENTTATKNIIFIGKSYFGTVEGKHPEITEDVVKGLQFNTLKNSRNLVYDNIQVYYGKVVYAYPAELGALTKIVDSMGFDYTDSYTMTKMVIDDLDYYCYELTDAMGTDGLYQKFS